MRVVVTGATGFMGSRLCAALADAGHDVRAFALRGVDASGLPPSVEVVYGDVTDEDSLAAAFHGRNAVFHAAAAVEAWLPDASVFHTVNVGGLENVLKAAKKSPAVKKIVYTSSYFAIGPTDGYVADEKQIHQGKSFCTEYEKSKYLGDRIALQAAAEGVPITIVYPGVMYGPGILTSGNVVCRVVRELPSGYIGDGHDRESFIHVDDVVSGHIAAMEKGRIGERYLSGRYKSMGGFQFLLRSSRRHLQEGKECPLAPSSPAQSKTERSFRPRTCTTCSVIRYYSCATTGHRSPNPHHKLRRRCRRGPQCPSSAPPQTQEGRANCRHPKSAEVE